MPLHLHQIQQAKDSFTGTKGPLARHRQTGRDMTNMGSIEVTLRRRGRRITPTISRPPMTPSGRPGDEWTKATMGEAWRPHPGETAIVPRETHTTGKAVAVAKVTKRHLMKT